MREFAINYGSTEQLINNLFNMLNNLDIEKSNVRRALNELYDLENYYSNKGEIISELEYRERKIDKDIRDTEDLIKSLQSFSRSVQETDERLAQKFKQDVKNYSKSNNIELVSELDKFLNKAEMTLDALGLVPGVGEVADGINGILSLLRGNWGNALISFGSMIPIAGDSLKGVKYLNKASDLLKMGDKVVDLEKGGKKLSKVADKLDDLKIKDIDFDISNKGFKPKEIKNKLDIGLVKKYVKDIEFNTGKKIHKSQKEKLKDALRNKNYERLSPREIAKHRAEFNRKKNKLINEWEQNLGENWPRYKEDVIGKNGKVVRKAGDKYDAHHIIENSHGGDNEWWNIHPAKFPNEHQKGIHKADSPARKLFDKRKEKK
jgi:hypothetical protein